MIANWGGLALVVAVLKGRPQKLASALQTADIRVSKEGRRRRRRAINFLPRPLFCSLCECCSTHVSITWLVKLLSRPERGESAQHHSADTKSAKTTPTSLSRGKYIGGLLLTERRVCARLLPRSF